MQELVFNWPWPRLIKGKYKGKLATDSSWITELSTPNSCIYLSDLHSWNMVFYGDSTASFTYICHYSPQVMDVNQPGPDPEECWLGCGFDLKLGIPAWNKVSPICRGTNTKLYADWYTNIFFFWSGSTLKWLSTLKYSMYEKIQHK